MIAVNPSFEEDLHSGARPLFEPGQLVRHKRYGYRGVVVSVNTTCKADPTWYMSNKTQPDREQPWYHVLVHGTISCTYAAQSSLRADDSQEPVHHVLVEQFFSAFVDGRYIRNEEPWPEG